MTLSYQIWTKSSVQQWWIGFKIVDTPWNGWIKSSNYKEVIVGLFLDEEWNTTTEITINPIRAYDYDRVLMGRHIMSVRSLVHFVEARKWALMDPLRKATTDGTVTLVSLPQPTD